MQQVWRILNYVFQKARGNVCVFVCAQIYKGCKAINYFTKDVMKAYMLWWDFRILYMCSCAPCTLVCVHLSILHSMYQAVRLRCGYVGVIRPSFPWLTGSLPSVWSQLLFEEPIYYCLPGHGVVFEEFQFSFLGWISSVTLCVLPLNLDANILLPHVKISCAFIKSATAHIIACFKRLDFYCFW